MPEKPSFPIIMFMVTFTKDFILDPITLVLTLLLVPLGWLFGVLVSFIYVGIFALWFFFRPAAVKTQRLAIRFAVRLAIAMLISWIPFVRFVVPEMTLLVWFTYRTEVNEWKRQYAKAQKALREKVGEEEKTRRHTRKGARRRTVYYDDELFAQTI